MFHPKVGGSAAQAANLVSPSVFDTMNRSGTAATVHASPLDAHDAPECVRAHDARARGGARPTRAPGGTAQLRFAGSLREVFAGTSRVLLASARHSKPLDRTSSPGSQLPRRKGEGGTVYGDDRRPSRGKAAVSQLLAEVQSKGRPRSMGDYGRMGRAYSQVHDCNALTRIGFLRDDMLTRAESQRFLTAREEHLK